MFKTNKIEVYVGDRFKGRRSGKLYTVTEVRHVTFGGHDVICLKSEDGERKQVASFRLYHKFEKAS